ncbi:hypothetical protein MarSH_181 [Marseillevirus Shanghai 1]|nr:hypothetical protein MarSH_181 [Marseillevirus Shanghai 1]
MEPSTVEKLEALRLHVQTLNDSLEDLRLQYDLCERRGERGRLQKEIEHLVSILDPLTCDLLAMEEATSRQELQSEKEEYQVCVREEEVAFGEIQEEWVGSFVKDEQGEVYRVTFSGDIADYLEKQRMMYDPLRWSSVDGRTRCFKKKKWSLVEFLVPLGTEEALSAGFRFERTISPFWIGKLVQKNGKVFKVLSSVYGSNSWRLAEMKGVENGAPEEGEFLYVRQDSTGWELLGQKADKCKEKVE